MSQTNVQRARTTNGKIGELLVEFELTKRGWHVERLDGAAKAVNGDLIALRGRARAVIQVKTNGTQKHRAFLGYAGKFLRGGTLFFNAAEATIMTDAVVSVTGSPREPRFFVFTVSEAESCAQSHAKAWYQGKTKKGELRSENFPISPKVSDISEFEDRWDKLEHL